MSAALAFASPPIGKTLARVRCREIREEDREPVARLLARGFRCDRNFWAHALARLSDHRGPAGCPRYGYLLESGGTPVGAILLIFVTSEEDDTPKIRCNVSSWYVEPEFRAYASMLVSSALRRKHVTYVNLTPGTQTIPILKAQGYRELCSGKFHALPIFQRGAGVEVKDIHLSGRAENSLTDFEWRLLEEHAAFGCISVVCTAAGRSFPFIFSLRRSGRIPVAALLIYCGGLEDFRLCAGALGRYLARRGIFIVTLHANGAFEGLPGLFRRTTPTFYNGPEPPRPGNLAWSECAMFGVRA